MAKKNVTLIFGHFEEEHLGKDVFLTPFYLGKCLDGDVTIVYPMTETNRKMPSVLRGVNLHPLQQQDSFYFGLFYLLKHVWSIDVLMQFHFCHRTLLLGLLFKFLHPWGKLYIKGDGLGILGNENFLRRGKSIKIKLTRWLYRILFKKVDWISIETKENYDFLSKKILGIDVRGKLSLVLNGFDEDLLQTYAIVKKAQEQKENIILTVGRLGTYQKNTEMLLQAIEQVDMKDWRLILLGSIEQQECDFQSYIDDFFERNPVLRDKVLFLGPIYDKKLLWEWYNRAKVFVFTSRFESFGIVLMEALRFGNYILSTNVGFAGMAVSETNGKILEQENVENLKNELQKVINNVVQMNTLDSNFKKYTWEEQIKNNIPRSLLQ